MGAIMIDNRFTKLLRWLLRRRDTRLEAAYGELSPEGLRLLDEAQRKSDPEWWLIDRLETYRHRLTGQELLDLHASLEVLRLRRIRTYQDKDNPFVYLRRKLDME